MKYNFLFVHLFKISLFFAYSCYFKQNNKIIVIYLYQRQQGNKII